jgi:hypothetical protein
MRIFKFKMYEITGQRILYSEGLYNWYALPYIITHRLIESKRVIWTEPVACMGKDECLQDFGGKARRRRLDTDGREILKWTKIYRMEWYGLD